MLRIFSSLIVVLFASQALAEKQWLTPDEFEAKVAGRATQIYQLNGELFGTEYFLPKRRTIWQMAGESQCFLGSWVPRNGLVCYQYQGGFGSCLRYFVEADKIVSTDWVAGIRTSNTFDLVIVNDLPPTCAVN